MRLTKRKRKVSVKIADGPTLEGILMGRSRGHYVLHTTRVFQDAETSWAAGECLIPVGRVLFYQVLS